MDELVREARDAWSAQDWERSAALYERLALQAPEDPRVGDWWYDAALAYKFRRNWAQAYRLGIQAAAHAPRGAQDPAFWNLGIAATIQRDWATARDAWSSFGIELPPGDGPIVGDFGRACVRLTTAEGSEVVWVQRLCPTRARVINVPFDTSRRYGEIVVHDGEPKGDRVVGDRTYRVFDELMLFEPSDLPTLAATVTAEPAVLEELSDLLDANGFGFEPLRNGYILCKCCSEGSVAQEARTFGGEQRCLIAAPPDRARELLDAWRSTTTGTWTDLHIAT
ncbi:tetratricopeptide repeat protein [Dactylosporangium sp. CA-139114]|uniref:tetratricopeptide repeat protein n=1 Tax=Dactylosporangium sp. CA-139114 TaxID=3239931 RepID=UPI003D977617